MPGTLDKNLLSKLSICLCLSIIPISTRPQVASSPDGTGLAVATIGAMGSSVVTGMMLASPTTAMLPLLLAGVAFAKGLLIGHLHGPTPHVDNASPYNAYYYDDLPGSTLYREDLPTYHQALQQHPENLVTNFNVDQSYQDDYVGSSYSPHNDIYTTSIISDSTNYISDHHHDDHYHDHDHNDHNHNGHYHNHDHRLVSDTYTG